jgi:transcriptional regulator with XRE-family HTH domain
MPRLITQRPNGRKRKAPPCGRIINYVEPRSPFQKLVDHRRRELALSIRGLAKLIGISQSSLWIWLHSENGFPHPKSFKPEHLAALARELKVPKHEIQTAIDASRHFYTPTETPMPTENKDAFRAFIDILDNDRRQTVKVSYVLNLARSLYNGATGEKA